MKKILSATFLFAVGFLSAQNVGIGTATPNASAKLDIVDANRGLLLPRVALTATTVAAPVVSPANWLIVFNTQNINDVTEGAYYWNGTRWVRFSTSNDWTLLGNAGTNPAINFIGTTDNQPFMVRTNNTERIRVAANGNVGVGTTAPVSQFIVPNNLALGINRGSWASSHDNARAGVVLGFRKSRGTEAAPAAVADTDYSACMISHNHDGAAYQINSYVGYRITGTPTANNVPGQIFFAASNSSTGDPYSDNTVRMVINNNGNVGIGTNTPIDRLQIANGNTRIGEINPTGSGAFPNAGRELYFSGGLSAGSFNSENSDPLYMRRYNQANDQTDLQIILGDNVGATNNDRLTIGDITTQRIALSASGHVGINTLSPAANLDIVGNLKLTDGTQGAYKQLTSDAAGIARWEAAPSDVTVNDVTVALLAGTATNLYTNNQVLAKGTYLVYFYNCIAASSVNYYLSASPELVSGTATINQPFIWDWSQNRYYTSVPSVLKIQSATAIIRGRVRHETGGTVTENAASCSGFNFVRIGD